MRDLDLGPATRLLIQNFHIIDKHEPHDDAMISACATAMAELLQRWIDDSWCWIDAAPARICGGPHVKVKYQHDNMGQKDIPFETVEHVGHVGEMFPGVPYTVTRS